MPIDPPKKKMEQGADPFAAADSALDAELEQAQDTVAADPFASADAELDTELADAEFAPGHDIKRFQNLITGQPDSVDMTTLNADANKQGLGMARSGAGLAGSGTAAGLGLSLAKKGVGKGVDVLKQHGSTAMSAAALAGSIAVPGWLGGNFLRYHAGRKLIEKLTGLGTKPDAIAKAVQSSTSKPASMAQGLKLASQQAKERGSGLAMDMSKLAPAASAPVSMKAGLTAAGEAGRRASEGSAAMAAGFAKASEQASAMPLSKAFEVISKGAVGAGKIRKPPALNASVKPQLPTQAPIPRPLSSNATEAKGMAAQALATGAPRSAIEQQLVATYDPATVKFVLAGLPNRLP